MSLYDDLSSIAYDLIGEFGQVVTITRTTKVIDPVTGTAGSPTVTTGQFRVVNPPASKGIIESFDNRVITEASNIYVKIRFLIVSAHDAAFEPRAGDKVTMGGVDYSAFGCTPIAPDGTAIAYRIGMGV